MGRALLVSRYIGVLFHSKKILTTVCREGHYRFWLSTCVTIHVMMSERQTRRTALILCVPFRLSAAISFFNVAWQKVSCGVAALYDFRRSWTNFFSCNAFLALLELLG
ncbi:hypothetical protein NXY56_004155 [Leishmania guyanensis]